MPDWSQNVASRPSAWVSAANSFTNASSTFQVPGSTAGAPGDGAREGGVAQGGSGGAIFPEMRGGGGVGQRTGRGAFDHSSAVLESDDVAIVLELLHQRPVDGQYDFARGRFSG